MYKIEKASYGYRLTFSGTMTAVEMATWVQDSAQALAGHAGQFGVLVDMRELQPLAGDAQREMEKGQRLYKEKGMARSAVILASALLTLQFKQIAKETGIYQWERYLGADTPDWENKAVSWLVGAVDPDVAKAA